MKHRPKLDALSLTRELSALWLPQPEAVRYSECRSEAELLRAVGTDALRALGQMRGRR